MSVEETILVITATMTALMAGLFFAWSCSVMLGFARLSNREFTAAIQATNRAIQNPVFLTVFFGAPIFLSFRHFGFTANASVLRFCSRQQLFI